MPTHTPLRSVIRVLNTDINILKNVVTITLYGALMASLLMTAISIYQTPVDPAFALPIHEGSVEVKDGNGPVVIQMMEVSEVK